MQYKKGTESRVTLHTSCVGRCAQDDFFWHMPPQKCELGKLPKFDASHELDMKRKRQAERGQHKQVSGPPAHCPVVTNVLSILARLQW